MTFLIVTHVPHKYFNGDYFAYGPYIREMNLWIKSTDKVLIVAPLNANTTYDTIDLCYKHHNIDFLATQPFSLLGTRSVISAFLNIPNILLTTYIAMRRADHIHLRCPGNMGLIGCVIQIFFPNKPKTAKYAGNWDWNLKQAWSYRLQQYILRNTFLTRNMTALVYGDWPDRTRNIRPFFTASYREQEAIPTPPRLLTQDAVIRLIFVGTLTENKRPILAIETVVLLQTQGFKVQLDLFGEGVERGILTQKILDNNLLSSVNLHGNVSAETIKEAYQSAHFLVFASRTEGWPKAVAEAMFWGCLPLTTSVSCVPQMLGYGSRGDLVEPDAAAITGIITNYTAYPEHYTTKCQAAMEWSRNYTLEFFEAEISRIVRP